MVDRDKQEANDNINGSMKKSNSEREQTEVAFFTESIPFFLIIYQTIEFNLLKKIDHKLIISFECTYTTVQ